MLLNSERETPVKDPISVLVDRTPSPQLKEALDIVARLKAGKEIGASRKSIIEELIELFKRPAVKWWSVGQLKEMGETPEYYNIQVLDFLKAEAEKTSKEKVESGLQQNGDLEKDDLGIKVLIEIEEEHLGIGPSTPDIDLSDLLEASENDFVITILNDDGYPEESLSSNDLVFFAKKYPDAIERLKSIGVSLEHNVRRAQEFCDTIRQHMSEWGIPNPNQTGIDELIEQYKNGRWFGATELGELADRWMMPLMLFRLNGDHWVVILKPPQPHNGEWQALVYDPLQGERYISIPEWGQHTDYPLAVPGVIMNKLGFDEYKAGTYDLTLDMDDKLAKARAAKTDQFQFNGRDCGLLCLYAMALREGMKRGNTAFKAFGIPQLQRDTKIKIVTVDEMLGESI